MDQGRLIEAIGQLTAAIEEHNQELREANQRERVRQDQLDELLTEIGWLARNAIVREPERPFALHAMPKDPADENWAAKLARVNQPDSAPLPSQAAPRSGRGVDEGR